MLRRLLVATGATAALVLSSVSARADEQSIIKQYGEHPSYVFEAEPHGILGFGYPFDRGNNAGIGFRGTFHITNGFVKSINDSIGIGVGMDFAPGGGGWFDRAGRHAVELLAVDALVGLRRAGRRADEWTDLSH